MHEATSGLAESDAVVVGKPDAATVAEVTPDVGRVTLKWTADATNAAIGTT